MRTLTALHSNTTNRFMHYVRLAFISGASTAFLCHSGVAQAQPDHATGADDGSGKAFIYYYTVKEKPVSINTVSFSASNAVYNQSRIITGPGYKFNITSFVSTVLPVNTVSYSNTDAVKMNTSAIALNNEADALSTQAKENRMHAKHADNRWLAVALCKKADSLDALSQDKELASAQTAVNATESQYEANLDQINTLKHNATYHSDLRTSATLLSTDAHYYYTKAITEVQQSDSSSRIYIKQAFIESARQDMETAVLKQQSAENIYISMDNSRSMVVAEKIDSILNTAEVIAQQFPTKEDPNAFGNVVFCVQIGSYTGAIPVNKANELLKIAGLGITQHTEKNGVTTFTIGQYSNFTAADMLSEELTEDGYKGSSVVSYSKDEPAYRWVIANK